MILRILIIALLIITISCNNESNNSINEKVDTEYTIIDNRTLPKEMKVNWDEINIEKAKFKFGDLVSFKVENDYYKGVLLDYDFFEGELIYCFGLCINKFNSFDNLSSDINIFARDVPFGVSGNEYIESYDLIYLNQSILDKNIILLKNFNFDQNKIVSGSGRLINSLKDIKEAFLNLKNEKVNHTPVIKDNILKAVDIKRLLK